MAKEDSSAKEPALLSSAVNSSIWQRLVRGDYTVGWRVSVLLTFHLSISSVSQGFSLSWVEGIVEVVVELEFQDLNWRKNH